MFMLIVTIVDLMAVLLLICCCSTLSSKNNMYRKIIEYRYEEIREFLKFIEKKDLLTEYNEFRKENV